MNQTNEVKPESEPVREPRDWNIRYWPADITFAYLVYKTWWFKFLLAAISGLLLVISFPPFGYGLFGWVALVPLLIAVFTSPSQRSAALCGVLAGAVFYSVALSFLMGVFGLFGLVLGNLLSLYLAIFAVSCWLTAARVGLGRSFILIPVFWTAVEFFRSECYTLKFPWLSLGYSQAGLHPLIQICDICGVYGLSFILMAVNALIAWFILERLRKRRWAITYLSGALVIFLAVLLYGWSKEGYQPPYQRPALKTDIPVAVVQEWIGSVDRYIKTTSEVVNSRRETLVVWPEACLQNALSTPETRSLIEALVKDKKLYLVFGSVEPTEEVVRFHNYAVVFSPEGEEIGRYAKRVPVQFIETVVRPGDKWGIFDTRLGKMGLLICYEVGFSYIARTIVRRGAEFLVVPTLEVGSWGGLSHQIHASMIPFRAVETRRPVLRSTALGISMIINPSGEIIGQLGYLASGVLRAEITKETKLTFYVKYGYLFPKICLWFYGVAFLVVGGFIFLINRIRKI